MKKQPQTPPLAYPYKFQVGEDEVFVKDYAAIKENLFSNDETGVLLGNGFNMSIGIQTGSANLANKLKGTKAIQDIHQMLEDIENKENHDLEEFTTSMGNRGKIVKKEIFRLIIQNSAPIEDSIAQKVMNFLSSFKLKFTTNYDSVAYLLVLWNDLFYKNWIKGKGPFSTEDIKKIFDTIPDALKKKKSDGKWSASEIRRLLYLESDDGFRPCSKRLKWVAPDEQKSFYLHGAFHLYQEGENVYKRTREEVKSLHSILAKVNYSHLSIFQHKDKCRKIRENKYLKHCYEMLEKAPDHLCIIGWNCAEKDAHLAKAIKKNENRRLFVSLHWQKSLFSEEADAYGEPVQTIQNYLKQFPKEKICFFDIDTVDYKIEE